MNRYLLHASLLATAALVGLAPTAIAQESLYSGTLRGELIVTGNALGLDVDSLDNTKPGTHGGVGAFMADPFNWASSVVGTFPVGTTDDWTRNGSSAVLDIPEGAGIDRAILLWSCSSRTSGSPTTPLDQPASVTLRLPDGTTRSIAPNGSKNDITLASSGNVYYQRWANVTDAVQAGGAGTYTVSGVVGLRTRSELSACGWSLFAVYTRDDLPMRNLNLWNIGESVRYTAPNDPNNRETRIQVSGFCTPDDEFVAPLGSMVVTALEGDVRYTGDTLEIYDPFHAIDPDLFDEFWKLSGPNNAASNFFASQINRANGTLDDRGTFGSRNHTVLRDDSWELDGLEFSMTAGARQGWDITTIPLNDDEYNLGILLGGQTETELRIATAGDDFVISAVGISLDFDSPNIVGSASADLNEVYTGDRVTYTFELANDEQGPGDEVFFCVEASPNLTFVPGSVQVDGAFRSGVTAANLDPANCAGTTGGLALGAFPAGASRTVKVQYDVTTVDPAGNLLDSVRVTPSWRSQWTPNCAGANAEIDRQTGEELVIGGVVLRYELTANPTTPPALDFGDTLTYTLTVSNVGVADSRPGVTARLPVPSGTTYVAGSSKLNNASINDVGGASPFSAADGRQVQSVGASAGVVAAGRSATASIEVTIDGNAPSVVVGRGFGDPDGPGPAPEVPATPVQTDINSDIIPDTDNDGVLDPDDNCPLVPNPLQQNNYDDSGYNPAASDEGDHCDDTDGDGLLDVEEDTNHNGWQQGETDATEVDTDGDGLCDGSTRVSPCVGAEDKDGDKDRGDWGNGEPSPIDPDTDKDGICDGSWAGGACRSGELDLGTDPVNTDSDRDGLCDGPGGGAWDASGCVGSEVDAEGDHGVVVVTDPANPDTDGDRLCDGFMNPHDGGEVNCFGYEDRDGDRDPADWVIGADETDPRNPDTDGGGVQDGDEFQRSTDPRDPCDDTEESAAACEPPPTEDALLVEGGGCGAGGGEAGGLLALGLALLALVARRRREA